MSRSLNNHQGQINRYGGYVGQKNKQPVQDDSVTRDKKGCGKAVAPNVPQDINKKDAYIK